MLLKADIDSLLEHYPALKEVQDTAWKNILSQSQLRHHKTHEVIFRDNEKCHSYFFLLKGSIRVQKNSSNGHSIVLYHLRPGDACELTTTSLLANKNYAGEAVTETAVDLIYISAPLFSKALSQSTDFQQFIFSSLEKGVSELIKLIETVAFHHIDQRLAHYLLRASDRNQCVHATHHDISTELGTAREVVSRVLKSFEHHHYVGLHRGWIELLDLTKLQKLASDESLCD